MSKQSRSLNTMSNSALTCWQDSGKSWRMAKEKMLKTFQARSRSWAAKNGISGPQAFLRYVMLSYLEALGQVSSDFVFKGGNLLWVYIETPRATVDLDLATLTLESHAAVRRM